MNLLDIAIIYLACGAPFGVYYFLTARHRVRERWFVARLGASFLFWFFFAARLIVVNGPLRYILDSDKDGRVVPNFETLRSLEALRRNCEAALSATDPDFRVYEFRESFERYVGLTLELNSANDVPTDADSGLGEVSGYGKSAHNSRCLHRRNLARLRFHREIARNSITEVIESAGIDGDRKELLSTYLNHLRRLVHDERARERRSEIEVFQTSPQSANFRPSLESQAVDEYALDRAA